MKKLFTFLLFAFSISLTQTSFGQTPSKDKITLSADKVVVNGDPVFECKKVIYDDQAQILTLIENVSLKTDKFEFSNAGRAVFDQKTKKLKIYDCKGFTIDGKIETQTGKERKNIVEYTIGDNVAYIL